MWFTPLTPTISVAASASCPAALGSARDVPDRSAGSAKLLPDSGEPSAAHIGHADDVDVWWNDSGCQTLDNGRLGAFEDGNPSFYKTFQNAYTRLVPPTTR